MNVKRKVTWKDIFNNFKSVYPRLSKEAQDYRPYNYMSIVVYLQKHVICQQGLHMHSDNVVL